MQMLVLPLSKLSFKQMLTQNTSIWTLNRPTLMTNHRLGSTWMPDQSILFLLEAHGTMGANMCITAGRAEARQRQHTIINDINKEDNNKRDHF